MAEDRVEIPKDSFVRVTRQLWKLVVGGVLLPVFVTLWGFHGLRSIRPEQPTAEAAWQMAVLFLGAGGIFLVLASVVCPRCRVRLLKRVFGAPEGSAAIASFLKERACPACGYLPAQGGKS